MAEKIDIEATKNAWLNVPMTLRSLMIFLIGCSTATLGMGQTLLPDWMLVVHGAEPSLDPPAGDDYYHDRMLNVGGTNAFIGRYEGKSTREDGSLSLTFTGWADSVRTITWIDSPGSDPAITLMDRTTGIKVRTFTRDGQRHSSIGKVVPNGPFYYGIRRLRTTGHEQTILGVPCSELLLIDLDTARVWAADSIPSPFADVHDVIDIADIKAIVMFPFGNGSGPHLPMRWEDDRIVMEITSFKQGACSMPVLPQKGMGEVRDLVQAKMDERVEVQEEVEAEPPSFTIGEEMPEFPGGEAALFKYLAKQIKYPKEASTNGVQGTVTINFAVEMDGRISEVQVLRGIGGGCDEEAVRVVKGMPNWKPRTQFGKAVRSKYNLPIRFKL